MPSPCRTAVVLFNLGGPDHLGAVRPFLFNLFYDSAILRLANPFRYLLAQGLSRYRTKQARRIYHALGGRSPLLENTVAQAKALEAILGVGCKTFVCMRYWHPMASAVVKRVQRYNPDKIVLLSMYPQYSTTTIESSLKNWLDVAAGAFAGIPVHTISCYPTLNGFAEVLADSVAAAIKSCQHDFRVLFSAHGLPKKIIQRGDPYQQQVEETVALIRKKLSASVDSQVCYQSRVGPMPWIEPTTDDEIKRAGQDRKAVILVPVSFVSEHSETLFELDVEYKGLAEQWEVPAFHRIATVGCSNPFIEGLADLCQGTTEGVKAMPQGVAYA